MKIILNIVLLFTVIILPISYIYCQPCPPINAGQDVSICAGDSTQLSASNGTNYTWSPTTGLSNPSINDPIAKPSITTTYTVSSNVPGGTGNNLIINGDFSQGYSGFTTDYTKNPVPYHEPGPGNYMVADSATLMQTGWKYVSPSGTGNFLIVDGSQTGTANVWCQTVNNVTANTTYTLSIWVVSMDNYYGQCSGDLHFFFNGTDIGHIVVPISNGGPWTHYTTTWTSGNNTSVNICIVDECTNFAANDFGIDDISLTSIIPPCFSEDSVIVTVNPIPNITVIPDSASICTGNKVSLTAQGANSFTWSPPTGLSDTTSATVTANPSSSITYTVNGESNGCRGDTTVVVKVYPLPVPDAGNDTTICPGKVANLHASGGVSYEWSPPSSLNNPNISNPVATPTVTTEYFLTVTNAPGCTATGHVTVTVSPLPVPDAGTDTAICKGKSANLHASNGVSYEWSPTGSLNNAKISNPVASPNSTTEYIVTVTNAGGCTAKDSVKITVNPIPVVSIFPDSSTICSGISVTLTATGATDYLWSPSSGLSSSISNVVKATPSSTTTYHVTGTTAGCSDSASAKISIIKSSSSLLVPNVFTPNGDGLNDIFKAVAPTGSKIESFHCIIFNRWGAKIYEWSDINQGWDGTHNGEKVPDGVYVYVINASDICGNKVTKYGTVTVLR